MKTKILTIVALVTISLTAVAQKQTSSKTHIKFFLQLQQKTLKPTTTNL